MRYGRFPWIDRFPTSRVPSHPKFRGKDEADVVIIGGGLTGCATAYALSVAGIKPVLLDADQIGQGASAASAGWIGEEPGAGFADLEKARGRRQAKRTWQAWHRASLDFAALIRRLNIKCALEPVGSTTVARTADQAQRLLKEHKARREAGFEAALLNARAASSGLRMPAAAGIRTREGATIDPYRAVLGLAAAAIERGAVFYERSPVVKVTFSRRTADVHTRKGRLRTRRVIVTTGGPTNLYNGLRRHFWFCQRYAALTAPMPAKMRQAVGPRDMVLRDSATPVHVVRWVDEDRLLVTGADAEANDKQRDKVIVQRTGQLMYELSTLYPDISGIMPEFGWAMPYTRTEDGLPFIGPHRNYPHHLFAFGDSSHTVTGAYLASRVLLRHHLGELDTADEVYAFR